MTRTTRTTKTTTTGAPATTTTTTTTTDTKGPRPRTRTHEGGRRGRTEGRTGGRIGSGGTRKERITDRLDRQDQRSRGVRGSLRSAYEHRLGPAPVCVPADHDAAMAYAGRIRSLLRTTGEDDYQGVWTSAERKRLVRLLRKWEARASGLDPAFEVCGTRPGGARTPRQKADLAQAKAVARLRRVLAPGP